MYKLLFLLLFLRFSLSLNFDWLFIKLLGEDVLKLILIYELNEILKSLLHFSVIISLSFLPCSLFCCSTPATQKYITY